MSQPPTSWAPGWYPDPLGSGGLRWWDGGAWIGPAAVAPAPGSLPGWAKGCFAAGIVAIAANCAVLAMTLVLSMFAASPAFTLDIFEMLEWSVIALLAAAVAAAARAGTRARLSVLAIAIAVVISSWIWIESQKHLWAHGH